MADNHQSCPVCDAPLGYIPRIGRPPEAKGQSFCGSKKCRSRLNYLARSPEQKEMLNKRSAERFRAALSEKTGLPPNKAWSKYCVGTRRRLWHRRKDAGLCVDCGVAPIALQLRLVVSTGKMRPMSVIRCVQCLEAHRESMRERKPAARMTN